MKLNKNKANFVTIVYNSNNLCTMYYKFSLKRSYKKIYLEENIQQIRDILFRT